MKTHGEVWYENKCMLQNSHTLKLDEDACKIKLPSRMERKEALKYYNKKLFKHWTQDYEYDKRISEKHIKEIVSALMFGSRERYKILEEVQ